LENPTSPKTTQTPPGVLLHVRGAEANDVEVRGVGEGYNWGSGVVWGKFVSFGRSFDFIKFAETRDWMKWNKWRLKEKAEVHKFSVR
jgi:hypothetical protein